MDCGAVYIFKYDPSSLIWYEYDTLINSACSNDDSFGTVLSADCNTLAISSYYNEISRELNGWITKLNRGAVYIFEYV